MSRGIRVFEACSRGEAVKKVRVEAAVRLGRLIHSMCLPHIPSRAVAQRPARGHIRYPSEGGHKLFRIVEPAESCLFGEVATHWSITGPAGPAGPPGPAGPAGVSGLERLAADSALNSNAVKTAIINCPAGKNALGGGGSVRQLDTTIPFNVSIVDTRPIGDGTGWRAQAKEFGPPFTTAAWRVTAFVICATVAP